MDGKRGGEGKGEKGKKRRGCTLLYRAFCTMQEGPRCISKKTGRKEKVCLLPS